MGRVGFKLGRHVPKRHGRQPVTLIAAPKNGREGGTEGGRIPTVDDSVEG